MVVHTRVIEALQERMAHLPKAPGVYLFKDGKGSIVYVGKAKSLYDRVKSYVGRSLTSHLKVNSMLSQVTDLEYLVTGSEKEALLLENTLIKRHRPRYNVVLKDDKNYPYLKLTLKEQFPRIFLVRKVGRDGSLYFGPFASAHAVRETMKIIHKHFLLRKCQTTRFQFRQRPCLNHQMGQCPAPCCRLIDEETYRATVREVELFLKGKGRDLIELLQAQMEEASRQLNFELAAKLRDRINSLGKTMETQCAVALRDVDRDVVSYCRRQDTCALVVLFVRSGKVIGSKDFVFKKVTLPDEEVLKSFLTQFYHEGKLIPQEILIPLEIEDHHLIEETLGEKKGGRVFLLTPRSGERAHLLEMARLNATSALEVAQGRWKDAEEVALDLKEALHLQRKPLTIECYDISNLGGQFAVGSMVCFERGEPVKARYRRFRIRTVVGADDCAMLYEVLKRRLAKGGGEEFPFPDLIVVDGGKGQLHVAVKVLQELHRESIEVIALAKARKKKASRLRETCKGGEHIFLPWRKNPLVLSRRSSAMLFLQKVRDEAHRFALDYHKKVRASDDFLSRLESIPGVGEKTCHRLLTHFGSIAGVGRASFEEIASLPYVNQKVARAVYDFLRDCEGK